MGGAALRDINAFISQRGGWMTSVAGGRDMPVDTLPGSALPERLRDLGYIVEKISDSQRVTNAGSRREQFDLRTA